MDWLKLSLSMPAQDVEMSEQVLWSAGADSITVLDAGDTPVLEPPPGTTPIWAHCRVEAMFSARDTDSSQLMLRLQQQLPQAHDWQMFEIAEREWQRVWMDDWQPLCFGERLWIYPSHLDPPADHRRVVRLDPGLAFGSGTHVTTALCLAWLADQPLEQRTVLDYGCGSGVLAIAALVLGAATAFAVDNDPQALQATRDNAARNGVSARLVVRADTQWESPVVDTVVANILAEPLVQLAARLAASQRAGGKLALTGILRTQQQRVCRAYRDWYEFAEPRQREDWVLLEGTRNARMS